MSQPSTQRPPQVTLAGSVVIVASVLVVLTVWEGTSNLRSLETRESIEWFLSEPAGRALGLDVEGAIGLLRLSGLVAGACAAATAVLGWFVMRRDKGARIALAVLAVPLFLTGLVAGGFASSFVAAAAAMLWLSPAREWFATGRWTPPAPRTSATSRTKERPVWPPERPHVPPVAGATGAPPGPSASYAGPAASQVGPYGDRPRPVVTVIVLTTVMSVTVGLLTVMGLVVMALSPELVLDEIERQRLDLAEGTSLAQLRTAAYLAGALCLLLCVAGVTLAGFVAVGREWARRALLVTAAFSAVAWFVVFLVAPVALLPAGAAVLTVVLLGRPETRAWCRRGGSPRRT